MEMNDYFSNDKSSTEEEESSLLKRLMALKKQLEDDDEPKLHSTLNNTKENVTTNNNVVSLSKFKYRKVNNRKVNNVHKSLSTKIDNRNFIKNPSKSKQNSLLVKTNSSLSKVSFKTNSLQTALIKNIISKKKPEIVKSFQKTNEYNLEINEIVKNSCIKNCKTLLNKNEISVSQTLLNIDKYMSNVQDYLSSSKYVVNKEVCSSVNNEMSNQTKNVHVNRKFQTRLISNNLLNSNLKNTSNSLVSHKKPTSIKKKPFKKISGKLMISPNLVKIGSTKLVRQSLFRNKWKINNKLNNNGNSLIARKPLSTLQCPTLNTILPSYDKTKWTNVNNPTPILKSKSSNSNGTNKLKWTRPSILLVNNVKNNNHPIVPKSDKLILFGKNKIIRQSLINSTQSKTNNYLLKHFSHRFALMRKLQQKSSTPKLKNVITNNEQQNILFFKRTVHKTVDIKRNGKRSYSMYSYINPQLRSKTNNNCNLVKTKSSDLNTSNLCTLPNNKIPQSLKTLNNKNKIQNVSLTNNKTLKNKKMFTKQLCLVFNRFGVCSKLDQGKCDKRHYKKFITLCTNYLKGKCSKEKCTLSHNIVEEKIPFCKHYLNSVCVQLNCPYLHEYRDKNLPICKNFLHGYCTLGKKCPKKHLNLCPIFESKNKCPHGQQCLYPHFQSEDKNIVDVEINEPRYFEITISNDESNESIHIVPKRRAPLTDLPSYIPLKQ